MRLFILGAGIVILNLFDFACALTKSSSVSECKEEASSRPYTISARHVEPGGIGYKLGYTTVEGFFSLYNGSERWLPFLDARCHIFNDGRPAVNAGLGLRYLKSHRIWGLNSYYDYRKTKRQHYNQVAFGLESLGSLWDVIPFPKNKYINLIDRTC